MADGQLGLTNPLGICSARLCAKDISCNMFTNLIDVAGQVSLLIN